MQEMPVASAFLEHRAETHDDACAECDGFVGHPPSRWWSRRLCRTPPTGHGAGATRHRRHRARRRGNRRAIGRSAAMHGRFGPLRRPAARRPRRRRRARARRHHDRSAARRAAPRGDPPDRRGRRRSAPDVYGITRRAAGTRPRRGTRGGYALVARCGGAGAAVQAPRCRRPVDIHKNFHAAGPKRPGGSPCVPGSLGTKADRAGAFNGGAG
jgi:hypothetical protein